MPDRITTPSMRIPTGQELDQQYDAVHRPAADAIADEEHPTPAEEQRVRDELLDDYAAGLNVTDPD